jgi:uncharacterized membrane protein YqaE (UPF0057 family)
MDNRYIIAIFFPPLAVTLVRGFGRDLLINILLTCLGILPGIVHAASVVDKATRRPS